jgi:ribonucleotide reductase alpha subunit
VEKNTELAVNLHSPLLGLFDQSRGLECLDRLAFARINLDGQEVHQLHGTLHQYLTELGLASSETIRQIYEQNSLTENFQIPVNIRTLFKTSREIDSQFHLEFQREMENVLTGELEKRIYFENPLALEKIKETLLGKLKIGIKSIGFFEFGVNVKNQEDPDGENARNFLLTLNKNKKRRHREIQPPLFQIKKTEEVRLPPVSNNEQ